MGFSTSLLHDLVAFSPANRHAISLFFFHPAETDTSPAWLRQAAAAWAGPARPMPRSTKGEIFNPLGVARGKSGPMWTAGMCWFFSMCPKSPGASVSCIHFGHATDLPGIVRCHVNERLTQETPLDGETLKMGKPSGGGFALVSLSSASAGPRKASSRAFVWAVHRAGLVFFGVPAVSFFPCGCGLKGKPKGKRHFSFGRGVCLEKPEVFRRCCASFRQKHVLVTRENLGRT